MKWKRLQVQHYKNLKNKNRIAKITKKKFKILPIEVSISTIFINFKIEIDNELLKKHKEMLLFQVHERRLQ